MNIKSKEAHKSHDAEIGQKSSSPDLLMCGTR